MKIWKLNVLFLLGKNTPLNQIESLQSILHFKRGEKKTWEKQTKKLPVCGVVRIWNSPPSSAQIMKYDTNRKQAALFVQWKIPQNYHRFQRSTLISPKPATWMNPSEVIHVPYFGWFVPPDLYFFIYLHQVWSPKKQGSMPWATKKTLLLLTFHHTGCLSL